MRNGLSDSESLGPLVCVFSLPSSVSCLNQHPHPNQTMVGSEKTNQDPETLWGLAAIPLPGEEGSTRPIAYFSMGSSAYRWKA